MAHDDTGRQLPCGWRGAWNARAPAQPRGRAPQWGAALACALTLGGCLTGDAGPGDAGPLDPVVEVGIPDPDNSANFLPLAPGGEVKVDTFGQGGYHAEVGIAFRGFGDEVYPQIVIENLEDGEGRVDTPIPPRAQPVRCDADGYCVDPRTFVMLGGLADVDDLDGLRVRITARIENDAGLRGEDSREAVLRREP